MRKSFNLAVQALTVQYQGRTALNNIHVTIPSGKITGIIGPNGAGKSTFIKGLLGLIKTKERNVLLNNQAIDQQKTTIAYVEQRSALDLSFPISVFETVLLGTYPNLGLLKRPGKKEKQAAMAALKMVQLEDYAQRQIGELSGGQLQRVFIARVLAQGAEVIFLDEPFVGLDMSSEKVIMDILKSLKNQGKMIIIVHHDLHKVSHYFDELIVLKNRLIAAGPVEQTFTAEFLQNALLTSIIVGLISGVIGSFIILRGMSLMGDAISHAVLPGVAVSYMFGFNYIFGASIFGLLAALSIGFITQKSPLKNDTAIGVVFSSFFALGIIFISFAKSSTDLYHILFGNVLAVADTDILITCVVGVIVLIFVALFYKELQLTSFDPTMAQAYGLNIQFFHYALMFLLTLVAVSSLQTVGTILVIAMLITPAATAYLLTNHLPTMIGLASTFGILSSVIGLFFSYSYNLASGATIVLTAALFFLLAFFFSPKKGLVFVNREKEMEESTNEKI